MLASLEMKRAVQRVPQLWGCTPEIVDGVLRHGAGLIRRFKDVRDFLNG